MATIIGNNAANALYGTASGDNIQGLGGNDLLYGGGGNDLLAGGLGNDYINGGTGIDTATWSLATHSVTIDLGAGTALEFAGTDTLVGIEHAIGGTLGDAIYGSTANNNLQGLGGNDGILGYGGNDVIRGGEGNDYLYGDDLSVLDSFVGSGNDAVFGDAGNDFLVGGGGNDGLDGGTGNDKLYGDTGNDTTSGGAGNDYLGGGLGNDVMTGGSGLDVFSYQLDIFNIGSDSLLYVYDAGNDLITDFVKGQDKIDLRFQTSGYLDGAEGGGVTAFDSDGNGVLTSADDHVTVRNVTHGGVTRLSTVIEVGNAIDDFAGGDDIPTYLGTGPQQLTVFNVTNLHASDFLSNYLTT